MAECPKCGAKVRKEKLRRHMNTVHSGKPTAPVVEETERAVRAAQVSFPWMMFLALGIAAALVVGGWWVLTRSSGGTPGGGNTGTKIAVMETNYGTIKIQLDLSKAPRTAGHFIDMANKGIYTPNSFHRVAANFVIQGGASTSPLATGVDWENTGLTNVKYSIAMARSGSPSNAGDANSATTQFFINLKDNPSLDSYTYPYVVFGKVIEGGSVVDTIGSLYPPSQPTYDGAPTSTVTIYRVTIQ